MLEQKIFYDLGDDQFFSVSYDTECNGLLHKLSQKPENGDSWERMDVGQVEDMVKFTADTVDQYVLNSLGSSIPVLFERERVLIWSKSDLDRLGNRITAEERESLLKQFPKLLRVFVSGIPDPNKPYLRVVQQASYFEFDPKRGASETVLVDAGSSTFMSASGAALTDIREIFPEEVVSTMLRIGGTNASSANEG